MKIDIDLNKMSEEEFINFLMNDINDYLLNELSPILQKRQDVKKWSAALDIIRANMNFYCLYHEYDISKAPPPQPYVIYPSDCSFDVKWKLCYNIIKRRDNMLKIRNEIFETNSSSVHAICVSSKPVDASGLTVNLRIGEFGWEHEWYQDIDSRASYIYTAACYIYDKDFYKQFKEMLEPYGIRVECDGRAKFSNWGSDEYYLDNGYVDHGGELQEFVDRCLNDPELLIRFIFGEESFVMTTNDNCDYYDDEHDAEVEAGNNELIWKWN